MSPQSHVETAEQRPEIGVYYFPNYHPGDPRNSKQKGAGWCEWELVKKAKPRWEGHDQPKVPLWGYLDESDPQVMAQKIDAAADHGVDAFIFDWYYYNNGPFLNRALDLGYLKAPNRQRVKFALMWANHDWTDIHPATKGQPHIVSYPGQVSPENFGKICDHIIRDYFLQPSYWKIDGRPYFSFYDLSKLLSNFGSVQATREALDQFRAKTQAAGLPGLHLNAVAWGAPILPGEKVPANMESLICELGFDSATSYVWIHHAEIPDLATPYEAVRDIYNAHAERAATAYGVPYFPNVSMGWDPSPRTNQSDPYGNFGYPFTNTLCGNTPERFRDALALAKRHLDVHHTKPGIVTINSWNEWTEGSYIEPDTVHKMGYLEAIRQVFGTQK